MIRGRCSASGSIQGLVIEVHRRRCAATIDLMEREINDLVRVLRSTNDMHQSNAHRHRGAGLRRVFNQFAA